MPSIEVSTTELRRAAGALRAVAAALAGDRAAGPDAVADRAVHDALGEVVEAADAVLRACEGEARAAADRLDAAADGYERADRRAWERLRW